MLGSELYSPNNECNDKLNVIDKQKLDALYEENKLILRGKFNAKYINLIAYQIVKSNDC